MKPGEQMFQYPGGNDLVITLNFLWQVQARELATDGLKAEYEDLLDQEMLLLWPLAKENGRDGEIWELLNQGLDEPDKTKERIKWARAKRERCWHKKILAMELAHEFFPLVNRVPDYPADMDEFQKFMDES